MTAVQKEIAEAIIALLKDKSQYFLNKPEQKQLGLNLDMQPEEFNREFKFVKQVLIDEQIIKWRYPGVEGHFMLADKGRRYGSYAAIEQKEAEREYTGKLEMEKLQGEVELMRNQLFDYQEVKDRAKWGMRLGWISAIAATIALLK